MRLSKFTIIGVVATASVLMASFVVMSRSGLLGGRRGAVDRPALDRVAEDVVEQGAELVSTESAEGDKRVMDPSTDSGWTRFRGPNGTGVSKDTAIPTKWSDTENLQWKCKLPGPGSSSPVLTDKYVFLTTYKGYGETGRGGDINQLSRQILCIDRASGEIVWTKSYDAVQPEDPYEGMGVPEHGYATNTPVTDGQTLYVFLGKSGVLAMDFEGNELWTKSVGTNSGNRRWGSAASLMLYDDLLIVNASEESQCIYALDKTSGQQAWEAPAASLELAYGTPAIVRVSDTRNDLVIAVPGEIWGLNPRTGKLFWYAETSLTGNLSPSLIVDGQRVFAFGGYRSSGSMAVRVGGRDDVTESHVEWTSRDSSYVATPVLYDGKLFWIDDRGLYYCIDAGTGKSLAKTRVSGIQSGGRPVYASPIVVGDKILIQTRSSGTFVLEPTVELTVLAQNQFAGDTSIFNATPAVDAGQLFLRSYEYLYCVSSQER